MLVLPSSIPETHHANSYTSPFSFNHCHLAWQNGYINNRELLLGEREREGLDHFPITFFHTFTEIIIPANKLLKPTKTMLRKIYKMEKENIKLSQLRWSSHVQNH